jgi:hypothetical protein
MPDEYVLCRTKAQKRKRTLAGPFSFFATAGLLALAVVLNAYRSTTGWTTRISDCHHARHHSHRNAVGHNREACNSCDAGD